MEDETVAAPSYEDTNENYEEDDDEEEEDVPRFTETNLSFRDFLTRIPHPRVVRACGLALRNFETNSPATNHAVLKLLHRIAFDCKMYVMVFQLSIFKTFQRILSMKDMPQYKELAKFATYILRQFFKVAETNKTVFVEALFWKSKRDAYEIENGYGSLVEKSKALSNFWSEEQEDELRRLFMEHQLNHVEEDVVDWIVSNLIDNTRTRRAVLKKLKEMYLLVDYKQGGGNRRSGARVPVTWGAEEEEQLRELYEEFKDAMDPIGCIVARLEVPRPKNRIVEKLLVMGLIQDKKEVRKKRARKSDASKSKPADSDSDSDSDDATPRPTLNKPKKPSQTVNERAKKVYKQRKKRHVVVAKTELVALLVENSEAGRNEALEWLKESMSDAIEDLQDGIDDGIPLVPIMDYAQEAMENEDFKKLLNAFGICEPFDEQEMYWRIPTHLSVNVLEQHCTLIQQALDGTLNTEQTVDDNASSREDGERTIAEKSDSNEDEDSPTPSGSRDAQMTTSPEKVETTTTRRSRRTISDSSDEEMPSGSKTIHDEDSDKENKTMASKKLRHIHVFDDSSEEENESSDKENGRGTRRRNTIDSDSEEENVNNDKENGRGSKKRSTIDSDNEDEENLKKRPSSSDSEEAVIKRRRIVDSDDGE